MYSLAVYHRIFLVIERDELFKHLKTLLLQRMTTTKIKTKNKILIENGADPNIIDENTW